MGFDVSVHSYRVLRLEVSSWMIFSICIIQVLDEEEGNRGSMSQILGTSVRTDHSKRTWGTR